MKHTQDFLVRADECGRDLVARVASVNCYLQEAAGYHATQLKVGADDLRPRGVTWMLLRLALNITRLPRWRDTVRVTTWPSGTRGRLVATREYAASLPPDETPFLTATSEWGLVDIREQRLTRITDDIRALRVPDGTPPSPPLPRLPEPSETHFSRAFPVRESQVDFNRHVNNSHYIAWIFDAMDGHPKNAGIENPLLDIGHFPARLDIAFRLPANIGDTVRVENQRVPENNTRLHTIRRESDNALLVHAQTTWPA